MKVCRSFANLSVNWQSSAYTILPLFFIYIFWPTKCSGKNKQTKKNNNNITYWNICSESTQGHAVLHLQLSCHHTEVHIYFGKRLPRVFLGLFVCLFFSLSSGDTRNNVARSCWLEVKVQTLSRVLSHKWQTLQAAHLHKCVQWEATWRLALCNKKKDPMLNIFKMDTNWNGSKCCRVCWSLAHDFMYQQIIIWRGDSNSTSMN